MRGTITIATLKEFLAAFNAHDLDAIMEFFSDDCELCMPRGKEPWGTRYVGKPAVREGLAPRPVNANVRQTGEHYHEQLSCCEGREANRSIRGIGGFAADRR